jgi:hypothetical protein
VNVEVLQRSPGRLPLNVKFGERIELGESSVIHWAAKFANTSKEPFSRSAERPVLPPRVLFSRVALPALKDPLEGIIDDPPVGVELDPASI